MWLFIPALVTHPLYTIPYLAMTTLVGVTKAPFTDFPAEEIFHFAKNTHYII